jgi:serine carboxypeptidase-like clade 1
VYALPILNFLRDPTVMEALHVNKDALAWDLCAPVDYTTDISGSIWVYENLKDKYRMLKLSGDTDGAVGTFGTKQWIKELDWKVSEQWRPYKIAGSV